MYYLHPILVYASVSLSPAPDLPEYSVPWFEWQASLSSRGLESSPLMVVLLQIKFVNESAGQPTGVYPLADREPERPAAQPSSLHAWLSAVYSILDQHILRRGTA